MKKSECFVAWRSFWRSCAIGGFSLGAMVSAVLCAAGFDLPKIKAICGSLGFLLGMRPSYAMFRVFVATTILRKAEGKTPTPNRPDVAAAEN